MSRRASYREGAAFGLLSFASIAVLGFLSGVVVARVYGIEVVGAFALAFAPVGICGTLSTLQEQRALVTHVAVLPPRAPRITGLFAAVLAFSTGLTIVVGTVIAAIAYPVLSSAIDRPDLSVPALALLAEYVLISNISWNLDSVFASFQAGRQLFWIRLLHGLLFVGLAVGLGQAWDTVWGLVGAQIGAGVGSLAVRLLWIRGFMALRVPRQEITEGLRTLPDVVKFGSKLAPGAVAYGLGQESGTWILGLTAPVAAVGAWSRAWALALRLFDPIHRVGEMLFPTLVGRRARGDAEEFDRALVDSGRYVATGLLLFAAVGGGAAHGIMELYGPGFSQAADALAIVLLVPVMSAAASVSGQGLTAVGRPFTISIISVGQTLVIVGLGAGLSLAMGLTGMALAQLAGWIVGMAWRAWAVAPHLHGGASRLLPARVFASTALSYLAGFVTARLLDSELTGTGGLAAALLVGPAAFALVFVLSGGLLERDRERLGSVVDGVRRRRAQRAAS